MTGLLGLNLATPPPERAKSLLEYLWHSEFDVWALTELGGGAGASLILKVCAAAGHTVLGADQGVESAQAPSKPRERSALLIARTPALRQDPKAPALEPPWRSRVASGVLEHTSGALGVAAVYGAASDPVRYSSAAQRARKRAWIKAFGVWVREWVSYHQNHARPAVVIGDLNLVPPGHDPQLRYVLAEERDCYTDLLLSPTAPLRDAYPGTEASWVDHTGIGTRYDHAWLTPELAAGGPRCRLDHHPREVGLSDHSAITLDLDL